MLSDIGASHSCIDKDLAHRLGLHIMESPGSVNVITTHLHFLRVFPKFPPPEPLNLSPRRDLGGQAREAPLQKHDSQDAIELVA